MSGAIDPDRLYNLLPPYIRIRDFDAGEPLRGLLAVISEQVEVVDADIRGLYENWFIETCDDWVVPYIADLVGYRPVHEAGETGGVDTAEGRLLNRTLIPRRELANTIGNRRRKGTLALLDGLAAEVAGWPGRAVEFGRLVAVTQRLDHPRPGRGRTADLRRGDALDRLGGPFDNLAHTVDLRRANSHRTLGRYNLAGLGLFAWRLGSYPVEAAPAFPYDRHTQDEKDGNKYLFSPLGNDTLLYTRAIDPPDPDRIADEGDLPIPIRLRALAGRAPDYYGTGKSLMVWRDGTAIPADDVVAADLSDWSYTPRGSTVAIDPRLGRVAFSPENEPLDSVLVSYSYGFGGSIGGGGYPRATPGLADYIVEAGTTDPRKFPSITAALRQWMFYVDPDPDPGQGSDPAGPLTDKIIEIADSAEYDETIEVRLPAGRPLADGTPGPPPGLTIRAASGRRPLIRLTQPGHRRDAFLVAGWHHTTPDNPGGRLTLAGLLVSGWGIHVSGNLTAVHFRDCTLVPGLALDLDCSAKHHDHPSLKVTNTTAWVSLDRCISGPIRVEQAVDSTAVRLALADTILDSVTPDLLAILGDCDGDFARASLRAVRCTVLGGIRVHELPQAENSIFDGPTMVDRRQAGCVRFSYVAPGSRTPRRFECQPDLALAALRPPGDGDDARAATMLRVGPLFESTRYGTPTYARLADACPVEIARGADDASEMGAFHDLFRPQREANLRARLDEYTPAGTDAGLLLPSGDQHDS